LLYHLANNPKKQEKLREEVMAVLPNETTLITHDTLKHISYIKACIKESLRLFPITNGTLRTMQTDTSIGGYMIPKGVCFSSIFLSFKFLRTSNLISAFN